MNRVRRLSPPSRSFSGSLAFALLALLLLPAMITLSFDYGSTWDEKARQKYGETVWEYLAGARDESVFEHNGPA